MGLYRCEPPKEYGGILRAGSTKREGKQTSQKGGVLLSEYLISIMHIFYLKSLPDEQSNPTELIVLS